LNWTFRFLGSSCVFTYSYRPTIRSYSLPSYIGPSLTIYVKEVEKLRHRILVQTNAETRIQ